ncbi:MAG: 50S ribosomal protein L17 [Patescibacteria group bacterium]
MRHRKKTVILDRKQGPRRALIKTQAISLILSKKIKTTEAKAKVLRQVVEKMITKAKKGTLASERELMKDLGYEKAVRELVSKIAPQFKDRQGGYTRLTKLGVRKGDGASLTQIEIL